MFGASRCVGSSYLVSLRRQSRNSRSSSKDWNVSASAVSNLVHYDEVSVPHEAVVIHL